MAVGGTALRAFSSSSRGTAIVNKQNQHKELSPRGCKRLQRRSAVLDRDAHSGNAPSTSTSKPEHEWSCEFYKASQRLTLERLYRMSGQTGGADGVEQLGLPGPYFFVTVDKPVRSEKSSDFYANVGTAIRTLRQDIPLLFHQDLDYNIYREDILFKDPRNAFQGMKNYKLIFWSLRFHGRIFFKHLYVEVKRIWQTEDDTIRMRWTVHGIPRVPWEAEGTFDGISYYKLDNNGKIYEHVVDNVILRDPPMLRSPFLAGLNLIPAAPQQQPCPGLWYEGGSDAFAGSFSWVRFYCALLATMQVLGGDGNSEYPLECSSAA